MRDAEEMGAFLASQKDPAAIATGYALRMLIQPATFPGDYAADPRWLKAIVPTAAGDSLLKQVSRHPLPKPDLLMALFGLFWFDDPLVDANASDLPLIRALIQEEALAGKIFWPMSQGRALYDRYNSIFEEVENDVLTPPDVIRLLKNAPIGIQQSGTLLVGPLGIIESDTARLYPPRQGLGLWHCPMLDCRRLHRVLMSPPTIPLTEGYRLLESAATDMWGSESRWEAPVAVWPLPLSELNRIRSAMPVFLGDCIVAEDRARLLKSALESQHGGSVRGALETTRHGRIRGDASQIISKLSTDEQLQLLLVLKDAQLKRLIDDLVWSGDIEVPTAELR